MLLLHTKDDIHSIAIHTLPCVFRFQPANAISLASGRRLKHQLQRGGSMREQHMPYYSVNTIASGLYGVLSSVAQLAVAGVAVPVMQSLTNYAALTANHVADRSASPTSRLSQSRIEAVLQSATVGHSHYYPILSL